VQVLRCALDPADRRHPVLVHSHPLDQPAITRASGSSATYSHAIGLSLSMSWGCGRLRSLLFSC
jgi:hypothetical protein